VHKAESQCQGCFGATLGSERNNVSERPHGFLASHFSTLDHRLPLNRANHTPSRLHSLLPSLFPLCSRQRRSTPSRSRAASVRPQPKQSLVSFFHFYWQFSYIFLYIQRNDDTYTHPLTTSLLPYHRSRLLSRDMRYVQAASFEDDIFIFSFISID
jgi:hypothetical protein